MRTAADLHVIPNVPRPRAPSLEETIAAAVKEAIDKRMPPLAAVGLVPPRYVQLRVAELLTGYSEKALASKIDDGVWTEGKEWRRAPDGRRLVDLRGFEAWVESGRPGE
jgi:hypothetical protein